MKNSPFTRRLRQQKSARPLPAMRLHTTKRTAQMTVRCTSHFGFGNGKTKRPGA